MMITKYIKLILIILISVQVFAQQQTTKDSLSVNNKNYYFTLLSYGKFSKSKPMKVFTCNKKDLKKVIENIQKCYKKYKIEYTEFYVIPIDKNDNNNKLIISSYLYKIDKIRMLNNLSTIQIPFREYYDSDTKITKFDYEKTTLKELNEIQDFHQNINAKNICQLISGRKPSLPHESFRVVR